MQVLKFLAGNSKTFSALKIKHKTLLNRAIKNGNIKDISPSKPIPGEFRV
jgi:hypothetical protein